MPRETGGGISHSGGISEHRLVYNNIANGGNPRVLTSECQ